MINVRLLIVCLILAIIFGSTLILQADYITEIGKCKPEEPSQFTQWGQDHGWFNLPASFSVGKIWICDAKARVNTAEVWVRHYVPITLSMVWIASVIGFGLLLLPEVFGIIYLIAVLVLLPFRGLWKLFVWTFDDGESHEADASIVYSLSSLTTNVEREIKVDPALQAVNMIVDDRVSYDTQCHRHCLNHPTDFDTIQWRINSISNASGNNVITPADFFPSHEETSSVSSVYFNDTNIARQQQVHDYSTGYHREETEPNKSDLVYAQVETYSSSNAASIDIRKRTACSQPSPLAYEGGYADNSSESDGETFKSSGSSSSSSIIPKSSNSYYHKSSEICFSDGDYQVKIEDVDMNESEVCTSEAQEVIVPFTNHRDHCGIKSHQPTFSDEPKPHAPCDMVKESGSTFKSTPEVYMNGPRLHTGIESKPDHHAILRPIAMRERSIQVPSCDNSGKASFFHPKYIYEVEHHEFIRGCEVYQASKPKDRDDDIQSIMPLSAQTRQDRVRPWLIQSFLNQTGMEEPSIYDDTSISTLHAADDKVSKTQNNDENILVFPKQKQFIAVSDGFITEPEVSPRINVNTKFHTFDNTAYHRKTEKSKPCKESSNGTFELEDLATPSHFSSDEQARIENECAKDILHDKSNKDTPTHDIVRKDNESLAPKTIMMDLTRNCRNYDQTDQLVVNVACDNVDEDDNDDHNAAEMDEYFEQDGTGSWMGSDSINNHNVQPVSYQNPSFLGCDQSVPLAEWQEQSRDEGPWTAYSENTEDNHVCQPLPLLDHLASTSVVKNHAISKHPNIVYTSNQPVIEPNLVNLNTHLDHQNMVHLQHVRPTDNSEQVHLVSQLCQHYSQRSRYGDTDGVFKLDWAQSAISSVSGGSGMVKALKKEFECIQRQDKIVQAVELNQRQPSAPNKLVHQWTSADAITHSNILKVREKLLQLCPLQEERYQNEEIKVATNHSNSTSTIPKLAQACAGNTSSIPSMKIMKPTIYYADQSMSESKVQASAAACIKAYMLQPEHTEGDVRSLIRNDQYSQRFADVIALLSMKMEQTDLDKRMPVQHLNQVEQHLQITSTASQISKPRKRTRFIHQQYPDSNTSTDSEIPVDNMPASALPHLANTRHGNTHRQSNPNRKRHGDEPLGSMSFSAGTVQSTVGVSKTSLNYLSEGKIQQGPTLLHAGPPQPEPGQPVVQVVPMTLHASEYPLQSVPARQRRPCTPFGGDRLSLCSDDDDDDSTKDFNLKESTTYVDMNNNSPRKYRDMVSFNTITETCYYDEESCASEISHLDQERIFQFLSDEWSEDESPPITYRYNDRANWSCLESANNMSPTSLHSSLSITSSAVYTLNAIHSLYAEEDSIMV